MITNTSWLLFEKILRLGVSFIITVWVARYLGPTMFGKLSYVQAVVGIVQAIAPLGLIGLVVREVVQSPEKKQEILGTTFNIRLFSGLLSYITVCVVFYFFDKDRVELVYLIGLLIILQSFDTIKLYFESTIRSKYTVLATTIAFLISSVLKVVFILLELPLIAFAWSIAIELTLASGLLIIFLSREVHITSFLSFNWNRAKNLLAMSWPLILSSMASIIYIKVDQIMLQHFIGDNAVGQYSMAAKLSEVWYFVPTAIVASFFPSMINLKRNDNKLYLTRLQNVLDLLFSMAMGLAILVSIFSGFVTNQILGPSYNEAGLILSIHIWTGIFVFMRALLSKWLINEGLLKFSLISHLSGAIINVALNFVIIPIYGGVGAAVATISSYAVSTYIVCYFSKKTKLMGDLMSKTFLLPIRLLLKIFKKRDDR